ncbi:MAG: hypothetical protein HUU26_05295 [Gemmatimonadaceae bacterium]|nr:hypothetical protein [Gemmatimonadaceae bacterium]
MTPLAMAAVSFAGTALDAQSLTSSSGASLSIAAPTESAYDAGVSGPSGNYSVRTTCTGGGGAGCRLFIQYGSDSQGQQVGMEYAVVALSSSACAGAVANPNTWYPVQPTVVVLSTAKFATCTATFRFRVSPLTWVLYQSPGPSAGSYRQRLAIRLTRP